jgi:hypothetical protein
VRFRFRLIPAVIALASSSLPHADELQTFEEAKSRIYPDEELVAAHFRLGPREFRRLKFEYDVPAIRPDVKAWRTASGDWLFLDQVYGLNDIVTYLLGVRQDGTITGLEVLVCAEGFCEELYTEEWLGQMEKATLGYWMPEDVVPIVSGSTYSTTHIAEGVKKLWAIHAKYLPKP